MLCSKRLPCNERMGCWLNVRHANRENSTYDSEPQIVKLAILLDRTIKCKHLSQPRDTFSRTRAKLMKTRNLVIPMEIPLTMSSGDEVNSCHNHLISTWKPCNLNRCITPWRWAWSWTLFVRTIASVVRNISKVFEIHVKAKSDSACCHGTMHTEYGLM